MLLYWCWCQSSWEHLQYMDVTQCEWRTPCATLCIRHVRVLCIYRSQLQYSTAAMCRLQGEAGHEACGSKAPQRSSGAEPLVENGWGRGPSRKIQAVSCTSRLKFLRTSARQQPPHLQLPPRRPLSLRFLPISLDFDNFRNTYSRLGELGLRDRCEMPHFPCHATAQIFVGCELRSATP